MDARLSGTALWLVGVTYVAMLGYVALHLALPYADQFDEIHYTLAQTIEEVFGWYFSPSRYLFRPFEVVFRFSIVELFGPYLNSYGIFQGCFTAAIALLAFSHIRARSWGDAGPAIVALTFLFGHHAYLAVMEANITFSNGMVMLFMLVVLHVVQGKGGVASQILAIVLSLVAILTKEVGLTVPFALVVAAMLGFPGARRWTAAFLIAIVGAYVAFRATTIGEALNGEIRSDWSGDLVLYLSNVLAAPIMMITGEPMDGDWRQFLGRRFYPWRVIRIGVGLATLAVILWAFGLRHRAARAFPLNELVDGKWLLLLAAVMVASAALGFQYTRHRFGAMALPIAFLLFYRALRIVAWHLSQREVGPMLRAGCVAALLTLSLVWTTRAADTIVVLRYTGSKTQLDWIENYDTFEANESADPSALRYLSAFFWAAQDTPWPSIQRDHPVIERWLGTEDVLNR